jgi:hypothetical protein
MQLQQLTGNEYMVRGNWEIELQEPAIGNRGQDAYVLIQQRASAVVSILGDEQRTVLANDGYQSHVRCTPEQVSEPYVYGEDENASLMINVTGHYIIERMVSDA